jgi:hypothetical protein
MLSVRRGFFVITFGDRLRRECRRHSLGSPRIRISVATEGDRLPTGLNTLGDEQSEC